MTEREKFEKWCKANKYTALYFRDDMYFDKATQMAWEAWQAAKATLFILPDRMDYELHGDKVINSHHNTWSDGYNQCLSDVISMNEEYSESAVLQWIHVSERLPEFKQGCYEYLVLTDGKVRHDYFNCPISGGDYFEPFWNYYGERVTHWMPLPTAPEQNK